MSRQSGFLESTAGVAWCPLVICRYRPIDSFERRCARLPRACSRAPIYVHAFVCAHAAYRLFAWTLRTRSSCFGITAGGSLKLIPETRRNFSLVKREHRRSNAGTVSKLTFVRSSPCRVAVDKIDYRAGESILRKYGTFDIHSWESVIQNWIYSRIRA